MDMSLRGNNKGKLLMAMLPLLAAGPAAAIQQGEPSTVILDGGMFYPSVGIALTHDDNILLTKNNKKSSMLLVVTPRGRIEYDTGEASQVAVEVGAESGKYFASSADNYLDLDGLVEGAYYPTEKLSFYGSLGLQRGHEGRGTGVTAGIPGAVKHPDRYHLWEATAKVTYGTDPQKLELGYTHQKRKYENNRALTILQDRKSDALTAALSMQIAPNTAMTLDGSVTRLNYDVAALDSTQYRGLVGLSWDATYQTRGFVKFGWQKKHMSSAALRDASGSSWDVGVDWSPLSYSTLQFSTSKEFGESDGVGAYTDTRAYHLGWNHDWSDVFGSRLSLDASKIKYGATTREDKLKSIGLNLDYRMRPWLLLGASVSHSRKDSNQPNLDYRDNQVGVQIGINM